MSILSPATGYGDFKVIDDATRLEIENWLWVDDTDLKYEVLNYPARWPFHGQSTVIFTVSAVAVNHAAREIHVNTPQPIVLSITLGKTPREASACDECCEESTCRRIGQCMRYRCAFGCVDAP
jgi:hypothetical protein